eukprot:CAMPEP_0172652484 /NCGR_PEP_ID=MMETSP1068-20121228/243337_1 /TAXON_ID=35684 /ORGANISM="Pseudopedinella elastica, Strain CCMP716" /LENGTH=281 /DNA_ID=CAMNT_0013466891 /DNA_START=53 /DNA_END=899 /DNA_ORIENTATION=-
MSSLADRIKIARLKAGDSGPDVNLGIQNILNCGSQAGTCHGGNPTAANAFVKKLSDEGLGLPFDTCLQYQAMDGVCDFSADAFPAPSGSCMTCSTFGVPCKAIAKYPNATVTEYGTISGEKAMMNEVHERGPIACGVNAGPLLNYSGGVFPKAKEPRFPNFVDHIIAIVGWGVDEATGVKYWDMPRFPNFVDHEVAIVGWGVDEATGVKYWDMRNSWGEYWGEMGWARVERGSNVLKIESSCDWAVGEFSKINFPCYEGGEAADLIAASPCVYYVGIGDGA